MDIKYIKRREVEGTLGDWDGESKRRRTTNDIEKGKRRRLDGWLHSPLTRRIDCNQRIEKRKANPKKEERNEIRCKEEGETRAVLRSRQMIYR